MISLAEAIPLIVFIVTLILLAIEVHEKYVITITAALVLIFFNITTFAEAISWINFSTLAVLAGMMILIEVSRSSGLFIALSVQLTRLSRGNPFYIFLLFCLFTAFFSMFFTNVTTILLIAPITLELLKGMGRDPKPYLLAEIFVSNIGGAGSLIGDPANIIIGSATNLSFNSFIINLFPPVLIGLAATIGIFYLIEWTNLKPITKDLEKMFISKILMKKIEYKFLAEGIKRRLLIKSIIMLALTVIGFVVQDFLKLSLAEIALTGAFILIILSAKDINAHKILESIQWSTLLFFMGLFVVVNAVEKTGLLEIIGRLIANSTSNFALLLVIIVWISGISSMILDNVAFVTVMIPIILNIQSHTLGETHLDLLWWALALGAVMGGSGTIIGASSNVVGIDIAKKQGINITFADFSKYGLPFAALCLGISSIYLVIRYYYF